MAPKRLFVFCDGTGQDGLICPDESTIQGTKTSATETFYQAVAKTIKTIVTGGSSAPPFVTNVLRLSRAVKPISDDGIEQIVYYQSGVGSESDFAGDLHVETDVQQAEGLAVASKIRDAYAFLAQNYQEGDELFLFGFSRGAFTARKLCGLIDKIGLLGIRDLGKFFNIWSDLNKNVTSHIPDDTRRVKIRCVGVWDTVGSVLNTVDALGVKDDDLPAIVDVALHALALQENRQKFLPTPWTVPKKGLAPGQVLTQVWFPGAHSDVGGSYARHELADIALFWMAGEIQKHQLFDMNTGFLINTKVSHPEDWGTSQPHNSFAETAKLLQNLVGLKNRLDGGIITQHITLHESWKHAPNTLESPEGMITPSVLTSRFSNLQFAPLNELEADVKSRWRPRLPQAGVPIYWDDPTVLFGGH